MSQDFPTWVGAVVEARMALDAWVDMSVDRRDVTY
jgi:hypothetical protein